MRKYGIKTFINLRGPNPGKKWYQEEKQMVENNGLEYHCIAFSAVSLPSSENIIKLVEIFQNAPKPIYIHCQGGADRTGMAAAIWMLLNGASNAQALKQLDIKYGHRKHKNTEMDNFIRMWQGLDWLYNQ